MKEQLNIWSGIKVRSSLVRLCCALFILFLDFSVKSELEKPFNWLLPSGHYVIKRTDFMPSTFPVGQFKTFASAKEFGEKVRSGQIVLKPEVSYYEYIACNPKHINIIRAVNVLPDGSVISATNMFVGISDDFSWSYGEYNQILLIVSNRIEELQSDPRCAILSLGYGFISEMQSLGLYAIEWPSCEYISNRFVGKSRHGQPIQGEVTSLTNNLVHEMVVDYDDSDSEYLRKFDLNYNSSNILTRVLISVSDDSSKSWHKTFEYEVVKSYANTNELDFKNYLEQHTAKQTSVTVYDLKTKKVLVRRLDGSYVPIRTFAQLTAPDARAVKSRRLVVDLIVLINIIAVIAIWIKLRKSS